MKRYESHNRELHSKTPGAGLFTFDPGSVSLYSTIKFGHYPQEADGKVSPISWIVLSNDNKKTKGKRKMLVMAAKGLDSLPYNKDDGPTCWAHCTLRTWLNNEFINRAFTSAEQSVIALSHLENINAPQDLYKTPGGPPTDDKIFILNHKEVALFVEVDRCCVATDYAVKRGAWVNKRANDARGNSLWWLRSPGGTLDRAMMINEEGQFNHYYATYDFIMVRPAMCIVY